MRILKSTPYAVLYSEESGPEFVDSKFRTFACESSPEVFIEAWKASSQEQRVDMEAALRYFRDSSDLRIIIDFLRDAAPDRASALTRTCYCISGGIPEDSETRWILAVTEFLERSGRCRPKRKLVHVDEDFTVWGGDLGTVFERKGEKVSLEMASSQLAKLSENASSERRQFLREFYGYQTGDIMSIMGLAVQENDILTVKRLIEGDYFLGWGAQSSWSDPVCKPIIPMARALGHRTIADFCRQAYARQMRQLKR